MAWKHPDRELNIRLLLPEKGSGEPRTTIRFGDRHTGPSPCVRTITFAWPKYSRSNPLEHCAFCNHFFRPDIRRRWPASFTTTGFLRLIFFFFFFIVFFGDCVFTRSCIKLYACCVRWIGVSGASPGTTMQMA